MKNKKIIILCIALIIIIVFLHIWNVKFNNFTIYAKSYEQAKKYSQKYLNENIESLTQIAKKVINEKPRKGYKNKSKEIYSIYYGDSLNRGNYVEFTLKENCIIGDTSFGLIYSPNDMYENEKELYIYDQSKYKPGTNDISVRKKLKKNWFFFYDDYDDFSGQIDLSKIK